MAIEKNCWEFKKCGRETGGSKVKELGVCVTVPNHGNWNILYNAI